MSRRIFLSLSLLSSLLLPTLVSAAVFQGNDDVRLTEAIDDDFFGAGSSVTINQTVAGDVFIAGEHLVLDSAVEEDVYAAGNTIRLNGAVKDDIVAAGNAITINSPEADDVMVAGNTIEFTPGIRIGGNVYATGQRIDLAGTITKSVRVSGENIIIKAGTVINGDLLSYGSSQPIIEDNVTIRGKTEHRLQHMADDTQTASAQDRLIDWVRSVVMWSAAGLLLLYLLPRFTALLTATSMTHSGRALAVGALSLLVVIPASVLLMVSVIGLPLGFALVLLAFGLFLIARMYTPVVLGAWLNQKLNKSTTISLGWQQVLLGVVAYQLLGLIPFVGILLQFILWLCVLGSLLVALWRLLRGTSETVAT